jgi:hypothetical protein
MNVNYTEPDRFAGVAGLRLQFGGAKATNWES